MRESLERALLARWYGRPGLLLLLWPLELLYRAVAAWRRARRDRARPPVPVVVVGNVTVGGAGKTPLVLALAEHFRDRGLRVVVISRGYGGSGPFPLQVLPGMAAAQCGDEPLLLARRLGVPVLVDPDRRRALAVAVSAHGAQVVVSDDGLQHYRLPRTVEIAVVDGARGTGNGHCLPVGPLREPAGRLRSCDLVVCNGTASATLPPGTVAMALVPTAFRRVLRPREALSVADFRALDGGEVQAVAGTGNPARFFATLAALGVQARTQAFPDHHAYRPGDLAPHAGRLLVMTEKDAVKCAGFAGENAWYLEVAAQLPPGVLADITRRAGLDAPAGT